MHRSNNFFQKFLHISVQWELLLWAGTIGFIVYFVITGYVGMWVPATPIFLISFIAFSAGIIIATTVSLSGKELKLPESITLKKTSGRNVMIKRNDRAWLPVVIAASIVLFVITFVLIFLVDNFQSNRFYSLSSTPNYEITKIVQKEKYSNQFSSKLLAGKKIDYSLVADTNYLGIIAIPFDTQGKSILDRVIFRIKATDQKKWYYEATYNTAQIQSNIPFPFGFPQIANSKGKSYTFEIESLGGNPSNAISLSKSNQFYLIEYKYPHKNVFKGGTQTLEFIRAKFAEIVSQLTLYHFALLGLSLIMPFIIYRFLIFIQLDVSSLFYRIFHPLKKIYMWIEK